jgi:hypothetical protein
MKILFIILILKFLSKECENKGYCQNRVSLYATECHSIKQNRIKPHHLSKFTCFKENVNFTMGTNTPIFKSDGEGPTRLVMIKPFCIDQTEVSNLQFSLYIKETGYVTEVVKY